MSLVALAVLNAVVHEWLVSPRFDGALALLSLALWTTVLILGRLVGYWVG